MGICYFFMRISVGIGMNRNLSILVYNILDKRGGQSIVSLL